MSKRKEPQFTDADLKTKPWDHLGCCSCSAVCASRSWQKFCKPSINGKTKTRRKTRLNIPP